MTVRWVFTMVYTPLQNCTDIVKCALDLADQVSGIPQRARSYYREFPLFRLSLFQRAECRERSVWPYVKLWNHEDQRGFLLTLEQL